MTYTRAVTAQLLDTDGTTVVSGTPLSDAFNIQFFDELNGPGSGQMSLSLSDAGAAEVTPGRFVQVLVGGTARFTFMIEGDPRYDVLREGEEVDEILTVSGRGWAAIYDTAIVYPDAALTLPLDSSWRLFSFASPTFPNAGAWAAATEIYEYHEALTVSPARRIQKASDQLPYPAPIGFPFNTSANIWDYQNEEYFVDNLHVGSAHEVHWICSAGDEYTTPGLHFFRRTLTIPAGGGTYGFAVTADNLFTLFLDGIPILGENDDVWMWFGFKETSISLDAGTYTLAAVVENVSPPASNPAGLICTVHTIDGGGLPNDLIEGTSDSWVADFDADKWPGWTPGQIFIELIDEAYDGTTGRSTSNPHNSVTFTATLDSSSAAWSDAEDNSQYIPSFAANVGGTIMAALQKAHEEGHIVWHVQPGALNLDIWAPGNEGSASGVSLVEGTNLVSLERGATELYANALLVQYEGGYVEVLADGTNGMPNEISTYGYRVEDIYSSEAATEDEAAREGRNELRRRIQSGYPAVTVRMEPTSTSDCPYEGFDLGDTVTIPAVPSGTEAVQVLSINCTTDEEGYAIWAMELNNRWRNRVKKTADLLQTIGGRSGLQKGVVQ